MPTLLEERKQLQNEIQELKGNIRVIARVRPMSAKEQKAAETSALTFPSSGEITLTNEKGRVTEFQFDYVAGIDCTQQRTYQEVKAHAYSVLDGYNCCIFAYGQTGSGKTYTMTGTADNPGVNTQLTSDLFQVMILSKL